MNKRSKTHKKGLFCALSALAAAWFFVATAAAEDVAAPAKNWPTLGQLLASFVDHSSGASPNPADLAFETRLVSVDPLPNCTKPQVRLEEVFDHSNDSDQFDMLYYNYSDKEQSRRANEWPGNVTGYEPKLYLDEEHRQPDFWQNFARVIRISCLPTRFRFTYIGSRRYREFREGERAWVE